MYIKTVVLLANFILAFAEDSCDCSNFTLEQANKESNDIVEFYNRLSEKDVSEDERYPVVPPGVVTGALGCQCENLRKKRKITPNEGIPIPVQPSLDVEEVQRAVSPRFSSRNCPKGRVRLDKICVELEYLL